MTGLQGVKISLNILNIYIVSLPLPANPMLYYHILYLFIIIINNNCLT